MLASSHGATAKRSGATFTELLEARKRQRMEEAQAQEQLHAALLQQLSQDTSSATNELLAELAQIQSLSSYGAMSAEMSRPARESFVDKKQPASSGSAASQGGDAAGRGPYKVALCMYYQTKGCTKGKDCTFAHGEEELLVHVSAQGGPNKGVMCKFFQQGVCRNGTMCRFAHTADEMIADAPVAGRSSKITPCKFFENGYCGRGDLCSFYHDESKAKEAQIAQTEEQLIEALMQQQMIELLTQQAASEEQSQAAQVGLAELMQIREIQKQVASLGVAGRSQSSVMGALGGKSKSGEDAGVPFGVQQPFKRTICVFWQEGKCLKGADCTFAHGEEELGMAPLPKQQFTPGSVVVEPEPSTKRASPDFQTLLQTSREVFGGAETVSNHRQFVNQQPNSFIEVSAAAYQEISDLMCKPHMQGNCKKGSACAYAHSGQDLVEGLSRMGICKRSLQGECTALTGRCKYQHIPDEQLAVVQHVASGQLTLSPCIYYAQGLCNEGMSCGFMHEGAPLAAPVRATSRGYLAPEGASDKKQMMCQFFQKGLCLKGDACVYAHSEDQITLPQNADQ